ncbi:hypothetical protein ACWD4P_21520 [Kitasatospora sp. NPDC002543]
MIADLEKFAATRIPRARARSDGEPLVGLVTAGELDDGGAVRLASRLGVETLPGEGAEPGFHIGADHFAWFQHALARTGAAGLTAFAGDAAATVPYLTARQGRKRYEGISHAAIGSVQDADHELLGIPFVGTDHVLRLNRTRVEAFSGVAEDLFEHLAERRLTRYRDEAHARRSSWPTATWDDDWDGPVSIHPDGSVLALRVLPERDC